MGLDITAYRQIRKVECTFSSDGEPIDANGNYIDDVRVPYINPHYPSRAAGIEAGVAYAWDDSFDFRAGSYGGYNAWRNQLAIVAGWGSDKACWESEKEEGLCYELICFSDCEGVFGSAVCTKLYKDFLSIKEAAQGLEDEWFVYSFNNWLQAFEMASDGGMVRFH